ncbi:MAG: DEAD/DEAH box helicase [Verrucomicrobia bacterium]|nr:DEAD/DEAH box helicase [Verrucomicrobiota bacterium]
MFHEPVPFPHASWMDCFSKNALRKGFDYASQRQVVNVEVSEERTGVDASVQGSEPEPYEVEAGIKIDPSGRQFVDGYCTCPVECNCKHVAAAIFAALEVAPDLFGNGKPAAKSEPEIRVIAKPQIPALPQEFEHWLKRLEHAARPAPSAAVAVSAQKQRLLYVLRVEHDSSKPVLVVKYQQARLLKDGGFGMDQPYAAMNVLSPRPARFIAPADVRIARRVVALKRSSGHYFESDCPLFGDEGVEILRLILETERCYWEEPGCEPLKLGAPRPAQLSWTIRTDGLQRPDIAATPRASDILPLHPPWYYDAEQYLVGPLELPVPPPIAEAWLSAPALTARAAVAVNKALGERFSGMSLPEAKALEVEDLPSQKPVPCLRLSTRRYQWWEISYSFRQTGMDGLPVHFGHVSFDYQGLRAEEQDEREQIEECRDGKLLRIRRDFDAEDDLLDRLEQFEITPASEVMLTYSDARLDWAWMLPKNNDDAWFKFCTETLPKLRQAGWLIEYDESFGLRIAEPTEWYTEVAPETENDWFGVELGVQVGEAKINLLPVLINVLQTRGEEFSLKKLEKMSAKRPVLIPLGDGRVLPFPAGRLREILAVLVELDDPQSLNKQGRLEMPKLRAAEVATLSDADHWRWLGSDALKQLGQKLKNFRGIQTLAPPQGLQTTLRAYQQDGLNWLQFLREYNLSGILADDMGLGKTVQALAHLLAEKEAGRLDRPSLVVAPTSLMTNWRQETERFAPSLRLLVSHGGERKQHFEKLREYDLIVTSYPLLPRDQEVLLSTEFHLVILDEAQYIKNPKTKWAQVACLLKSRHQLCLTGTPMENHLGELWSLFNFLLPGFLGDEHRFRALFRNPIEKANNQDRRSVLAHRLAPFILRRRKEEVEKELPPKTEIVQNVELSDAQRDLYESIRLAMHAKVQAEIANKGLSRSHIIILDALLKLRQVCCDPQLVPLEAAKHVQESAKLELLMDLLPEMLEEGRHILLFSQFTSMLALIEEELAKNKIAYVKLTGETRDRATPVNDFQSGKVPLFLISLKAGGTGLNLTAADTVVHYDPWWNPAVENQATDRAHRIGQDKKVFVYKLMTIGTVEEKIAALQARKRELVEGLLNEDRKDKLQLSAEDLEVLFAPLK